MEESGETNSNNTNTNTNTNIKVHSHLRHLSGSRPRRNRSRPRQTAGRVRGGQSANELPPFTDDEKTYFHHYSYVSVHEEMLKDRVRTETYRKAIVHHRSRIEGKVVVDVGCGTGILSIFCAQAGAKRVYAVDASDIALNAEKIVKDNNLSDIIIVLHRRIEDVQIDEGVDVIVSEWMGYMLLHESMLWSVIIARDRWLKPGGLMLPSNAALYMAPITHPNRYAESIDFWRNVYGIDMSSLLQLAKQCAFEGPCVETISRENVLTIPHVVMRVDCYKITRKELESVTTNYKLKSMMRATLHGFAFWFDVKFSGPAKNDAPLSLEESTETNSSEESTSINTYGSHQKKQANPDDALVLSTGPDDTSTHWKQTMLYCYDPIDVEQDQAIEGSVTLTPYLANARFMTIHLEYTSGGRSFVKESVL